MIFIHDLWLNASSLSHLITHKFLFGSVLFHYQTPSTMRYHEGMHRPLDLIWIRSWKKQVSISHHADALFMPRFRCGFVWKCRVPRKTQWFCWSLSLRKMAILLGVYPIFRHTHVDKSKCWRTCCLDVLKIYFALTVPVTTCDSALPTGKKGKANSVVCTADPGPDGINVWFDFTSTERLAQLTLWGFSLSSKALTAAQDIFQPIYQVVFRCFACVTL